MDARLKAICGLLTNPDPLRRTAAAIVLAELAPPDAAVARALGEALPDANQTLTTAILDAFDAIGSRTALPYLLPLLDVDDVAVKMRAIGVITKAGGAALPLIQPLLADASQSKTLMFVDMLARIPTGDAMRALLQLLPDADADLTAEIAEAVHRHARPMPPAARGAFHKRVAQFMTTAAVKNSERLQGACLRLLGALARPEARPILVRWACSATAPRLRIQALRGLQDAEWTPVTARPVFAKVRTMLSDPDADVAEHASRVLAAMPAATLTTAQWRAMLDSANASARSMALTRLAEDASSTGKRALLALLQHTDTHVQESAAGALARQPGAATALLDALLGETDPERAWRLAKILKPHAPTLKARDRQRLKTNTASAMNRAQATGDALLYLLRHADGPAADALHRDAAQAAMREKRWADAVVGFRRLMHSPGFDDDSRYALSICNLKLSLKELAPALRANDFALRGFHALLRNAGYKLPAKLLKDKALDAEDFYYVGFHFSEMTGSEREFGDQLLRHVLTRWPRTPAGKTARTKLGVTGKAPAAKAERAKPSRKS